MSFWSVCADNIIIDVRLIRYVTMALQEIVTWTSGMSPVAFGWGNSADWQSIGCFIVSHQVYEWEGCVVE